MRLKINCGEVCANAVAGNKELQNIVSMNDRAELDSTGVCKESVTRHNTSKTCYTCEICVKSFSQKGDLSRHLRIHTREKPYRCEICFKSFTQNDHLKCHLRIHTGEKPYTCAICLKSFAWYADLRCHLRRHRGEKPYNCEVCTRSFVQIGDLNRHLRIHKSEKPYICEMCQKSYKRSNDLKRHLRLHSGEKPYLCEICHKSFGYCSSLKAHRRKIHKLEKSCTDEVSLTSFTNHKEAHHSKTDGFGTKLSYESCKKSFVSHQTLKHDMNSCKKGTLSVFENIDGLTSHSLTETGSTGQRSLFCKLCSESFLSADELQSHSETSHLRRSCRKSNLNVGHLLTHDHLYNTCTQMHSVGVKCVGQNERTTASVAPTAKMISNSRCFVRPDLISWESCTLNCKMYGCGICDEMFSTEAKFLRHCSMHKGCLCEAFS